MFHTPFSMIICVFQENFLEFFSVKVGRIAELYYICSVLMVKYNMIESLSVTNYYCFKERTTIFFTAGKERNRVSDNSFCGFTTINKVNILKLIYLLGNNGAGKSKILSAFSTLKYLVTTIRERKDEILQHRPFAFDETCTNSPSIIELIYHINEKRYSYIIKWNKEAILEERLQEIKPRIAIELFNRWYDEEIDVTIVEFMAQMKISENEKYIINSSLLKNNSVFSTIINTNVSHSVLKEHMTFFMNGFEIMELEDIDLDEDLPGENTHHDKQLKRVISSFLQSVDTNIMSYEKLKIDVKYPIELLQHIKTLPDKEQTKFRIMLRMDEDKYTINTFHRLEKNTGNRRCRLPLSEQSEGTKEILRLLIILNEAIEKKKTIILDDYSSGIQRNTLNQLLKFFLASSTESQLIISTQDYSLLDFDLIRRDSIRFLIKNDYAEASVEPIKLSLLHKNSSLRHYVSKMNVYKQLPQMNDELFNELLHIYKTIES